MKSGVDEARAGAGPERGVSSVKTRRRGEASICGKSSVSVRLSLRDASRDGGGMERGESGSVVAAAAGGLVRSRTGEKRRAGGFFCVQLSGRKKNAGTGPDAGFY